jgi:DNA-binding MarR family transcriptional regulator
LEQLEFMSNKLHTLANAFTALRDLDQEMQAQTALTFLHIACAAPNDISMRELKGRLGISGSSISRNVAALSKHHRLGKAGHDLVESYEDSMDRRNKLVRLTPKGKSFAFRLSDLLK